MDWREKVTYISSKVFPGLSEISNIIHGNVVLSNLPLQMSLFFNVTFFPVWLLVMVFYLKNEYNCFGFFQKFAFLIVFIFIILTEILRIYLGYLGNLNDKISELAAFWLLSVMLQAPLEAIILINPYFNLKSVEFIVHSTLTIMLIFQIIIGYFALKGIIAYQSARFKLRDKIRMKHQKKSRIE